MRKVFIGLCIAVLSSCGKSDDEQIIKTPVVNKLTDLPVEAGANLTITGSDLDFNTTLFFKGEPITPITLSDEGIILKIPENATSGLLEINFQDKAYNTQAFIKILDKGWTATETSNYFQIEFATSQVGYAKKRKTNTHIIDKSVDGGTTWFTILEIPTINSLMAVASKEVIYIRTTFNLIKKTVDGGSSWQDIKVLDLSYIIEELNFINESEGYLFAEKLGDTYIFKTIDGGKSWQSVLTLNTAYHNTKILFLNDNTLNILDKSTYTLHITEDFGSNWTNLSFDIALGNNPLTPYFLDKNNGWLYAEYLIDNSGGLFITDNAGHSWRNLEFPDLTETIVHLVFFNQTDGHILTDKGGSFYTKDGGKTWQMYYLNASSISAATHFKNVLYIVANGKFQKKTLN